MCNSSGECSVLSDRRLFLRVAEAMDNELLLEVTFEVLRQSLIHARGGNQDVGSRRLWGGVKFFG